MLYRVFPATPGARPRSPGGPLYAAREAQGSGRHDNPDSYGALYLSASPVGAIAERLQAFRNQRLEEADLVLSQGRRLLLVTLDDARVDGVLDLDEPRVLLERSLRPSRVATHERRTTQRIARHAFEDGATGVAWWSTLEASWINVTLFAERAPGLAPAGDPEVLSLDHPALRAAADALGVGLASAGASR